ncbi:MAG: DbpA RNA binding domain-containing protein [Gemmatimonadales bacterium]
MPRNGLAGPYWADVLGVVNNLAGPSAPNRGFMQANRPRREPEVLRDLLPAIERGRHIAMLAATGSGHELVFKAAALSDCETGEGTRALILSPTRDAGLRLAAAIGGEPSDRPLDLVVWPSTREASEAGAAPIVIGPPLPLLRDIRRGQLQTSGVKLICIDGADQMLALGEWPSAEAILDTAGSEARKVVASASFEGDLADLLKRQLSRARRWPEELFSDTAVGGDADGAGPEILWYGAAVREVERMDLLAAALAQAAREAAPNGKQAAASVVISPDERSAERLRSGLRSRGVAVHALDSETGPPAGAALVIAEADEAEGEFAAAVRWSLPEDLEAYTKRMPTAGLRMTIVDALHLPQLSLLARRAGWELRPVSAPPAVEGGSVERFRQAVRDRLQAGDVSAELLLLEPLLRERPAAQVAGALAALLRERPEPEEPAEVRATEASKIAASRGSRRAVLPAWTRIFISVGKRDGAGPGDIVGAIAGESGASGGQIGKVEIRSSFTLVDIDAEIADLVIDRLRGVQIKGRTVVARRSRETGG